MKVLIINGSPKNNGNTACCANLFKEWFNEANIECEIYHLGDKKINHCLACGSCFRTKDDRCIQDDDLNDLIQKVKSADAYIFGSPIHYADCSGLIKNCLDRLFYVAGANGNYFRHKVGASYVCVRRSGGIHGLQTLNNYITYSEMFMATGSYWNIIHCAMPEEVLKDKEGINTIHALANNMIYLMHTLNKSDVEKPAPLKRVSMNFIRKD
ncbi:MAG: flavodoxin family protein [Bacilli bacterium]|nr:flavodoxin family protein [Bacilli bacterium]